MAMVHQIFIITLGENKCPDIKVLGVLLGLSFSESGFSFCLYYDLTLPPRPFYQNCM